MPSHDGVIAAGGYTRCMLLDHVLRKASHKRGKSVWLRGSWHFNGVWTLVYKRIDMCWKGKAMLTVQHRE
jgi:hypothetical protein